MAARTRYFFDTSPLGPSLIGAAIATAGTIVATGAHHAPERALCAAFIGAAIPFIALEIARRGLGSPAALFVIGIAYYHIIVPFEFLVDPEWPSSIVYELPSLTDHDLLKPLLAANIALWAFLLGFTLRREKPRKPEYVLDERRLVTAAGALVGVGVLMYLGMSVVATGSWTGIFSTTYQERDELFYGLGALGFGIDLVYVGMTCLAVTWISRGGMTRTVLAVALCAVMGVHSFLVGSKMHVFHVGLGTLAGMRAVGARLKPGVAAALIVILLVPILFVGLARNKQGEGFGEMYGFVQDEAEAESFNPANLDAWGPYLTLVHTTKTVRVPEDIRWGWTYTQVVTLLPPRFLYPGRPRPVDEEFAEAFLGKDYYDNAGYGYSGITEGYVNGGLVGVGIAFLVFGLGLGAARDALARRRGTLAAALIVATAAPWAALGVREQAAAIAKGWGLMTLAPTLVVLWLAHRRARAATATAPTAEAA